MTSNIYFPPSLQRFQPRRMVFSTWVDHLPFAYDIVEAIRPGLVVELGVYNGLSFFTFCQSMQENDIDGVAYAVDCWEGDDHTDAYDDSIYKSVQEHSREYYRGTSYLLKMYFQEALQHFEDDSIDLLHIDGLHTYDAVKEDFETWYPKVKPGGIILFHDVMAKIKDFGAWKFFEELQARTEDNFRFDHGFGLGVIRKPGGATPDQQLLQLLFSKDPEEQQRLKQFYVHASHFLELRRQVKRFKLDVGKPGEHGKGGQGKAKPAQA